MKKIGIILCFLLTACTLTIEIPDVESLSVSQMISSYNGNVSEHDEKEVMQMFYGKYEAVSRNQVNMLEESDISNILFISYEVDGETTSITCWSSGYGTMSIGNQTMYIKFHDGVHEKLLNYILNR